MPPFGPIKRGDLIRYLRRLGFAGPYRGGHHFYLRKGPRKLTLPNPQQGDISRNLLRRILQQAGISRDEWEQL
jgi:predicted RNA binding protein YcfA (HicA-like mRNA interferase family)